MKLTSRVAPARQIAANSSQFQEQLARLRAIFFSWSWVILFTLSCYVLYEQALKIHRREFLAFSSQFQMLQAEKEQELTIRGDLKRQIHSQTDPAWIEIVLMDELGLTPEGQIKIYFH